MIIKGSLGLICHHLKKKKKERKVETAHWIILPWTLINLHVMLWVFLQCPRLHMVQGFRRFKQVKVFLRPLWMQLKTYFVSIEAKRSTKNMKENRSPKITTFTWNTTTQTCVYTRVIIVYWFHVVVVLFVFFVVDTVWSIQIFHQNTFTFSMTNVNFIIRSILKTCQNHLKPKIQTIGF